MRRQHAWAPCLGVMVLVLLMTASTQGDGETWVQVRRINDGDTIILDDNRPLRYLGINTPEIDYKNQRAEPYAYAARRLNRKMVDGHPIRLEFEKKRTDRFGRLLAYVFLEDNTFVNRQILLSGYGYFYPSSYFGRYDDALLKAQRTAMTSKKGIWRDWKEPKRRGAYIANRRSKRFHTYNCPNAQKMSRKNRIFFNNMWDAFWEGYAPAKGCVIDNQ